MFWIVKFLLYVKDFECHYLSPKNLKNANLMLARPASFITKLLYNKIESESDTF